MARRYPMLRFAPGVDWKHVSPVLLARLSKLAAATGHIIDIFSGYRPPNSPYGFKGDPHQRGIAVDAKIDGKDIGLVISPQTMAKYGMRSGNQPGFYKKRPDPSHVDLVGYEGKTPIPTPTTISQAGQEAAAARPAAQGGYTLPPSQVPQLTPDPSELTQPPLAPGSVDPGAPDIPNYMTQAWLQVANQPNSSPETQQYAQMFGQ